MNSDSSGAVTMPPSMGAAMRLITSEPVPEPHTMGTRPARITATATVMALDRTRSTAPSRMASSQQFLLPHVIGSVRREMPKVKVRIEVATHANLARMLRIGELDLLVVGESYRDKGLVSRTIVEDVIVPVAAASHAISKVKKPTMRHLSQHAWILQPDNVLPRQWIDQAFDRAGLPGPEVEIETNMLNLQPELIAAGGLLSFLPRKQLGTKGKLREIKVREATMRRRLELRCREGSYLSPVARRVMGLLIEVGNSSDIGG